MFAEYMVEAGVCSTSMDYLSTCFSGDAQMLYSCACAWLHLGTTGCCVSSSLPQSSVCYKLFCKLGTIGVIQTHWSQSKNPLNSEGFEIREGGGRGNWNRLKAAKISAPPKNPVVIKEWQIEEIKKRKNKMKLEDRKSKGKLRKGGGLRKSGDRETQES